MAQGGKRTNAGRKKIPANEKVMQVSFYIQKKYINKIGKAKAQKIARESVESSVIF